MTAHPLGLVDQSLIDLANRPDYHRWHDHIRATGGCSDPIHLIGYRTTPAPDIEPTTTEQLAVRCRNRRATRCPSCSYEHRGDTFHLVRAGLTGGKTVPPTVADHPRAFATLTAPSFGAVHRATPDGRSCRPRRDRAVCEHGNPLGCPATHTPGDQNIGQPLCPGCYDHTAHTLWNAHAGALWDRFTRTLRRRLAQTAGVPRSRLRCHLTVSFAKVAEYQARGAIHLHAVVRLDGPDGPDTPPPAWATADLLTGLIPEAAHAVHVDSPYAPTLGAHTHRWGRQLDVRPLRAFGDTDPLTDHAVAAYLAKYVSKSTEAAGGTDFRVTGRATIAHLPVSDHVRALMRTCWDLGALPELAELRLRPWTHTLGYRGHVLTKSRAYSTTYGALRAARAAFRQGDGAPDSSTTWRYLRHGHTPGEAMVAAGIAEDLAEQRDLIRELAADRGGHI